MAKKVIYKDEESKEYMGHFCRECRLCEPVMKWNTLTVKDRLPTLGKCPHNEYCVLLSQKACKKFKHRI